MKASSLLFAAALTLSATGAFAQSTYQSFTATAYRPTGSSARPAATTSGTSFTRRVAGGGSITYFGATCSTDARHEQFTQLRQAFEASKPTVVFFEKPDCGVDSTEAATISRMGEGGYVRYLAQQHQVRAQRLDDPEAEYAYLQTKVDAERLKLYYLLRYTNRLTAQNGSSKAVAIKQLKQLLANSSYFLPGTEQVIHNVAEFETAYQKYCPNAGKWWKAPAAWFKPSAATASTSSAFIKEIASARNDFREQRMYRQLTELAQRGERVFVVVDQDYLPSQGSVLASK
jgi:hypothetical protein